MGKERPWRGQLSDRGQLKNKTEQNAAFSAPCVCYKDDESIIG